LFSPDTLAALPDHVAALLPFGNLGFHRDLPFRLPFPAVPGLENSPFFTANSQFFHINPLPLQPD
jgi:hypothetical protein